MCLLQAPSSQQLILLATCHCNPSDLPQAFLAFFSGTSPAGPDSAMPDNIILLEQDLPELIAPAPDHDVALQQAPPAGAALLP